MQPQRYATRPYEPQNTWVTNGCHPAKSLKNPSRQLISEPNSTEITPNAVCANLFITFLNLKNLRLRNNSIWAYDINYQTISSLFYRCLKFLVVIQFYI